MIEPELYCNTGSFRLRYIEDNLKNLSHFYEWNDNEQILDVGCGTGEVTCNILLPYLPSTAQITGLDISEEMIKYAAKNYNNDRIKYVTCDIENKLPTEIWPNETFDKIFSLFSLQLINDLEFTCKQLFNLLKKNGYITIHLVSKIAFTSIVEKISEEMEWKTYFKNFRMCAKHFEHSSDSGEYLKKVLSDTGFNVLHSRASYFSSKLDSIEQILGLFKSITPYFSDIPHSKKDMFFDRVKKELLNHKSIQILPSGQALLTWQNTIAVAKK